MTLYDILPLILPYASSDNPLIPLALPIQCCVHAVVFTVLEIQKSTLFGGRGGSGGNVSNMLENRILL